MKVADLYIRVSTDEQADKGYSQRGQEEVLTRYCLIKEIKIRKEARRQQILLLILTSSS
jgi:site-specific DNA recombinase